MVTFLFAAALASGQCTTASEYVPPLCPNRLPRIQQIMIEHNGIKAYEEAPYKLDCSKFQVTKEQVRQFLSKARQTDPQAADATLNRSPCRASGRVRFADGRVGKWEIEQLRVGTLSLPGGSEMVLFCTHCRGPFIN